MGGEEASIVISQAPAEGHLLETGVRMEPHQEENDTSIMAAIYH